MRRVVTVLASAALVALLSACATPADPRTPRPLPVAADVGLADVAATPEAPAQWWRAYGDERLDRLVEQALAGQPNLQVLLARAERARAGAAETEAATGPQLNARADATWQRYTEHGLYPPPIAGSTRNSASLGVGASASLDFFGRHAAELRAALGTERAAQAEVEAARALIATQVVRGWLAVGRLEGQRTLAARVLALRDAQLRLTRQRFEAGLDTRADLLAAESARPEATQQAEALAEQSVLARRALAALCGLAPQALDDLAPALPAPRALGLPATLGADLLGRRADVRAARWRVESAGAAVDVARAAFYPDVNLVAFADVAALGLQSLLALPNREYGVGPALRLPIFDGGRLRAAQRGREAELDAAIAAYRGVVIDAAREALDAIASLRSLERQAQAQAAGIAAAERALALAAERRRGGVGTEGQLIAAELPLLALRRVALDLQSRAGETQATLFHALGGDTGAGRDAPPLLRPLAAAPTPTAR